MGILFYINMISRANSVFSSIFGYDVPKWVCMALKWVRYFQEMGTEVDSPLKLFAANIEESSHIATYLPHPEEHHLFYKHLC